jgi:hypothetical protein
MEVAETFAIFIREGPMTAINISNVKPLNVTLTPLSPERMKELGIELVEWAQPKAPPPAPPSHLIAPDALYAEIKVNGKTVAKVFNSGSTETPNSLAGRIDLTDDGQGPSLAQIRAEEIAKALGGKIVKADTAQTQSEWARGKAQERAALDAWSKSAGYGPNVQADILLQAQEA